MVKYLLLLLSLLSLAKASDAQTNCRSECVVSGKSHICQWETVCDPVTPEPTPEPTPSPTPEPAPLPAPTPEPTPLPPAPLPPPQPTPEPYPLPPQPVPLPPQPSQPPEIISVPSMLNPTNPLSILNPNSPLKPPTVPLQIPQPQTNMVGNDAPTQENSAPPPTAQTNAEETPNGKTFVPGFGLVLSLELMVKPRIVQPNLFPDQHIGQEIPNDYKYQMHDLYAVGDPNTFRRLTKDTVELEQ